MLEVYQAWPARHWVSDHLYGLWLEPSEWGSIIFNLWPQIQRYQKQRTTSCLPCGLKYLWLSTDMNEWEMRNKTIDMMDIPGYKFRKIPTFSNTYANGTDIWTQDHSCGSPTDLSDTNITLTAQVTSQDVEASFIIILLSNSLVILGGLRVTCSPRDSRFVGSNPAVEEFFFRT